MILRNLIIFNIQIKNISQKRNIVASSYIENLDEMISISCEKIEENLTDPINYEKILQEESQGVL